MNLKVIKSPRVVKAGAILALIIAQPGLGFAQAAGGGSSLATGLGIALGIIMAIAFIMGCVLVISGAMQMKGSGGEAGKMSIVAGVIIAAAPAIMYALFNAFGLSGSVVTAQGF